MPNNELQEILSKRFERFTQPSSDAVWTAIEAQLDEKSSNRIGIWFWLLNGIAASLLVSMTVRQGLSEATENMILTKTDVTQPSEEVKSASMQMKSSTNNESTADETADESITTLINTDLLKAKKVPNINTKETPNSDLSNIDTSTQVPDDKVDPNTVQNVSKIGIDAVLPPYDVQTIRSACPSDMLVHEVPSNLRQKKRYFSQLPISVGVEFTYLHNVRTSFKNSPVNWSNDPSNQDEISVDLSKNRKLEFTLFSQFDLTRWLSTSIGAGYSTSKANSSNNSVTSITTTTVNQTKSNQQIFTLPIQATFRFLQSGKLQLITGFRCQTEFISTTTEKKNETISTSISFPDPQELSSAETTTSKVKSRQFAIEPFLQFSVALAPRFSTYVNLGYRKYLQTEQPGLTEINLHFLKADFGIQMRLQ